MIDGLNRSDRRLFFGFLSGVGVIVLVTITGTLAAFWAAIAFTVFGGLSMAWKHARISLKMRELALEQAEREANFAAVPFKNGVVVYNCGDVQYWGTEDAPGAGAVSQIEQYQYSGPVGLLDAVSELDCLMVWGGRGSGKTNFLRCLALVKAGRGEKLWIIDPKPSLPGKWPRGVNVIGHGHNYEEIRNVTKRYDDELKKRKADFVNVRDFPKVTLVVDELFLLNMKIKGFMDMVLPLLIEGREYNIHLIIISQSKTAGSLGLKGKYDLLECFDAVVGLKRNGPKDDPRSYSAVVDFDENGEVSCVPPGAFEDFALQFGGVSDTGGEPEPEYPGRTQQAFPQLGYEENMADFAQWDDGSGAYVDIVETSHRYEGAVIRYVRANPGWRSINEIVMAAIGYNNKRVTEDVKSILAKHGLLGV